MEGPIRIIVQVMNTKKDRIREIIPVESVANNTGLTLGFLLPPKIWPPIKDGFDGPKKKLSAGDACV